MTAARLVGSASPVGDAAVTVLPAMKAEFGSRKGWTAGSAEKGVDPDPAVP